MPRARRAPVICNTEHQDQSILFRWAALVTTYYPDLEWLYAIPNFSGRMGKATIIHSAKLNKEGRKKGYPDIGLDVARGGYHGLRIELKRVQGGKVQPEQEAWHTRLLAEGYQVVVARGWEEAKDALISYIHLSRDDSDPKNPRVELTCTPL